MKKLSLLLILMLNAAVLFAQGQGEFLVELDPATGDMTKIGGPIPSVNWVFWNNRAYDEVNGRYIFQGGPISPTLLNSIDVTTGDPVYNPQFTDGTIMAPEFDNSTQTYYAIKLDNSTTSYYLQTVDPATGVYTPVATTPTPITGLTGFNQTMNTIDEFHHQYIFTYTYYVTNVCTLYSVDLTTGAVNNAPIVNIPTTDRIVQIVYNNDNDTLYGLIYEDATQKYYLCWLDMTTGDVTKIGNGTTFAANDAGATLDVLGRRFIYNYSNLGVHYLSVMKLDDGSILFNNVIPLDPIDNVHGVKYDNVRHRLFAMHWDNYIQWPLALHLLSFDAQKTGKTTANISWKIAEADGDETFFVEHSTNGQTFSPVASLKCSKEKTNYTIQHQMVEGNNYYRLKTVDINNRSTYSDIKRLSVLGAVSDIALLPNVVNTNTTLQLTTTHIGKADLLITDIIGKQVYKTTNDLKKGTNTIPFDLSFLASGSYTLHVKVNDERVVPLKFVKL